MLFSCKFILLLIMYSSIGLSNGLQIAEHFAQPNLVANCSRTELICSLSNPTSDATVSWKFHGEDASKLPSTHIQRDFAESRWRLIIDCTTIRHSGTYVCNAHSSVGKQDIIYRKEAVVQVYVPVQVNIDQPQIKQSSRNSAKLECLVTGYPRVQVKWFKLQRNIPSSFKSLSSNSLNHEIDSNQLLKLYKESIRLNRFNSQTSDYVERELNSNVLEGGPTEIQLANNVYRYVQINVTVDSKFTIENRMLEQFDDSQMQSMLTIHRLDADDAGLYVCRAKNSYGTQNENAIQLYVLETPKLRLVTSGPLNSRSIELKLAILHNSNAPVQQLIIALRNNNQTINHTNLDNSLDSQTNSLSFSKDWIIMDIINLQSDQNGNVIGGSIEEQNQTHLLSLSQFLDNPNFVFPFKNNSVTKNQSPIYNKQIRRSINRFELIEPNVVRYIINNLQPKADYSVQVYAQNEVGRSTISPVSILTQPDVPSRVKNVHILTRTNETLLYGWKRSADNGAEINRYEVQLAYGSQDNWLRNETKDVNLTSGSGLTAPRNNYMYIFVNLKSGSIYYFRVRACNEIGCSEWSHPPLLGITQDGYADPPENIRINCFTQKQGQQSQQQNLKDTSLDIQPLIQYNTNSGEHQSSIENQQNFKYQKELDNDQFAANEEESMEQQNTFLNGRSSPTAELLIWPLDNNEQNNQNLTIENENKHINKRSLMALKNHKKRKHRKIKRSIDLVVVNNKTISLNDNLINSTNLNKQNNLTSQSPLNDQNDLNQLQNFVTISWEPPIDARGTILGYNISLDALTRYINENGKEITERRRLIYEIRSNLTNEFTVRVNPNTRHQVRMSVINKAGSGKLSSFSTNTACDSAPTLNKNRFQNVQVTLSRRISDHQMNNYPQITPASHSSNNDQYNDQNFRNENSNKRQLENNIQFSKNNQLVLNLPRLNEREGRILCYRIVMIRLPKYEQLIDQLSNNEQSTYKYVNKQNETVNNNNNQTKTNNLETNLNNQLNKSQLFESSTLEPNSINLKNDLVNNSFYSNNDNHKVNSFNILSILPSDPINLPVYRYEQSMNLNYSFNQKNHLNKKDKPLNTMYFTYLAKEMSSNQFRNEILIGDKSESSCSAECIPNDLSNQYLTVNQKFQSENNRQDNLTLFYAMAHQTNTNNNPVASARSTTIGRRCVYNGELEPNTNYTGFIEIHVAGVNGSRLIQRSNYFKPISTDNAQPQLSSTTTFKTSTKFINQFDKLNDLFNVLNNNSAAIVFGTICGLVILLMLLLCFILCCFRRKFSSNRNSSKKENNKKVIKNKVKKQHKKSKKSKKEKEDKQMTDLDRASYNEECIDNEQIKLNENEIIANQSNSPKNLNKCLEIDCDVNNYDINYNNQVNNDQINNTLKRQSFNNCLENQLNLEDNDQEWQTINEQHTLPLPPPPQQQTIINQQQQISYQPAILIDANQQLATTNDTIHFLHLKQSNPQNLTNIYEQTLANNLININNHLNFNEEGYSIYNNQIESINNYQLNNHHQQSIDNESTNSTSLDINNSINSAILSINTNENENDVLTAHKWIGAEFPMKNIHEVFLEKHANNDQLFEIEFNLIPFQFPDRTFNHSSNQLNKIKNRYQNILCFDQTRVKLGNKTVSFATQIISQTMPRQSSSSSNSSTSFTSTLSRTLRRKKKSNESSDNSSISKKDDSSTTNSPSILSNSQQNNNNNNNNNDYIHANHVQLNEQSYIATQSPLSNTVKDFWLMILENNVNILVALCDLEEDGRQTCASYWNEQNIDNGLKQLGEIRIQLVQSRKYNDYILRRFTLTKRINNQKINQQNRQSSTENEICREIVQFQFLKYNEYHDNEQPSWLLCFISKINEFVFDNNSNNQISSGPILVHCEDGCSRTGTFIAIRALMSLIQYNKYQDNLSEQSITNQIKTSSLNIFDYVSQLRYQRYMLVDSLQQYIFIYRAALEYIKFFLDDLNDDYVEQHIKLNTNSLDFYSNRLSYGLVSNPVNDIVTINYHNITQSANAILPEFDV